MTFFDTPGKLDGKTVPLASWPGALALRSNLFRKAAVIDEVVEPAALASIFLVRHGETELNRLGVCQGWADEPLNEAGRRQAQEVAMRLKNERIAAVVSSPLLRAHQTALEIARHHGLPVTTHEGLREINHGRLERIPFDRLDEHVPGIRHAWRTAPHTVCMPDGETLHQLQLRATEAFLEHAMEYLERHRNGGPYGHLVLVAHAVTIGSILCHVKSADLSTIRAYRLLPCGYWKLHHDRGAWAVGGSHGLLPEEQARI